MHRISCMPQIPYRPIHNGKLNFIYRHAVHQRYFSDQMIATLIYVISTSNVINS